jgi:hypothetical protein
MVGGEVVTWKSDLEKTTEQAVLGGPIKRRCFTNGWRNKGEGKGRRRREEGVCRRNRH